MIENHFLDDVFLGCAMAAFVEVWRETGCFPPDSEAVRQRAYRYYEEGLAGRQQGSGQHHD